MWGYLVVSDFINKLICIFKVAGVEFGGGVNEVVNVFCNMIGLGIAIADYRSTNWNNKGDRPSLRRLVNLGEQVEEERPGLIRTVQVMFLFDGDVAVGMEAMCDVSNKVLCF